MAATSVYAVLISAFILNFISHSQAQTCNSDADCTADSVCNTATGQCEATTAGDAGVSAESATALLGLFLQAPQMLTCNTTATAVCDNIGFSCQDAVCIPTCQMDEDCAAYGTGTGFNTCNSDGECTFNPDLSCSTDDDCPSIIGWTCDTSTSTCVQPAGCSADTDCTTPGLGQCNQDPVNGETGICSQEYCSVTVDCLSAGYVCGPIGICVPGCESNTALCEDQGFICDTDSGLCTLQCSQDSDCGGYTNTCSEQGICTPSCTTDADCADLGIPMGVCDVNAGLCHPDYSGVPTNLNSTSCTTDDDCDGMTPTCNTNENVCYPGCTTDSDCQDIYSLADNFVCEEQEGGVKTCSPDSNLADRCSSSSDCDDGYVCLPPIGSGVCVVDCDTDEDCAEATGYNAPCQSQSFQLGFTSVTVNYCNLDETVEDEDDQGEDCDGDCDSSAHAVVLYSAFALVAIVSFLFA